MINNRFGNKNACWRGGRRRLSNGYIVIYMPSHLMATIKSHKRPTYILEHRLVMAYSLNRLLGKDEVVHHKNGIRDDNRIENLELTNPSKHVAEHNSKRKWRNESRVKLSIHMKNMKRDVNGKLLLQTMLGDSTPLINIGK